MRSKKTLSLIGLVAASGLVLSACGGGGDDAGGPDKLVVGIKFDQPGLGLREGDTYTGFDVDMAKELGKRLGYEEGDIEFKETPSPQRETLIETNQVDIILATYSITDEREQKVDFGGPYLVAGQSLLVRADDSSINSTKDLDGKKLCSVKGSTSAQQIAEEVPGVALQEFDTYSNCVTALGNGTVDALTTDDAILAGYAAQSQNEGKYKLAGDTFSEELYGVGFRKDRDDDNISCEKINKALTEMFEDGTWEKAVTDNLGKADYEPNAEKNPPKAEGHC